MILKNSLDQNGGENQDGRQTIKRSQNNANNLQLRILEDWTI
jgi:hypothetical protein